MQMAENVIRREQVLETYAAIRPYIRRTPTIEVDGAELGLEGVPLSFKLESMQVSGSFKSRGAFAHLVLRSIPAAGVVAASGGNHGAAVAYAAMRLRTPASIFVPTVASAAKVARIRASGAQLFIGGERYTEAFEASERWRQENGALPIPAFDAVETLLGTATIALEIEQQLPQTDTLLVPVGGGGLIAGIASYFGGRVKVIAVEPEGAPKLTRAIAAGRPVDAETGSIAADALAPRRIGSLTFPLIQRFVERVVLVSDDDMREAQLRLWNRLSAVAEPAGAAAAAALFSRRYVPALGERVCALISGANTTAVDFTRTDVVAPVSPKLA
jgi:threonine dehydratase